MITMETVGFQFDNSYRRLPKAFYHSCMPDIPLAPNMILLNEKLASALGLSFQTEQKELWEAFLSGKTLPLGAEPMAMAYAGHQFGHFTMLGDGRAHLLGEHITPQGKRVDLHLKGSGKTAFSRRGDGKATLKAMLREYIMSEAMAGLQIPTSRSLAVILTGETIQRETPQRGAVLSRIASSHIRVGTFEYAAEQEDPALLQALLDYGVQRHFPSASQAENVALSLLENVIETQASLLTHWMRIGFIHGVMNTDNMALSGETIDYGPCAFMDSYSDKTVFSSIDHGGRYAYGNQPLIAAWNIARLAESLLLLIDTDIQKAIAKAEAVVNSFKPLYDQKWLTMMRAKIGLSIDKEGDKKLIQDMLHWMEKNHIDYTNFFYDLGKESLLTQKKYQTKSFQNWYQSYQERLSLEGSKDDSLHLMQSNNPVIIPRNHQVEKALEAAEKGNLDPSNRLLECLRMPYQDKKNFEDYKSPPTASENVYQTFCGT